MKKIDYYMEVKNTYKLNNYFGGNFYTDERMLEVKDGEILSDNNMVNNFFKYYKDKLLSYKIDDLKAIFKDCNFRISHLIITRKRSLSISRNHIEFYDYENSDNSYYDMDSKYEEALLDLNRYIEEMENKNKSNKQIKSLNNETYKTIDNDIIFHTRVDDLDKDNNGIYIIKNGIKKYVYNFVKKIERKIA
ncbi:MAG: hypothetical protein IJ568_01185 [Bacilli bacterium]|nr:hypothetical protein [Bacilli bacterium]